MIIFSIIICSGLFAFDIVSGMILPVIDKKARKLQGAGDEASTIVTN